MEEYEDSVPRRLIRAKGRYEISDENLKFIIFDFMDDIVLRIQRGNTHMFKFNIIKRNLTERVKWMNLDNDSIDIIMTLGDYNKIKNRSGQKWTIEGRERADVTLGGVGTFDDAHIGGKRTLKRGTTKKGSRRGRKSSRHVRRH
jgi:hypothetical protein